MANEFRLLFWRDGVRVCVFVAFPSSSRTFSTVDNRGQAGRNGEKRRPLEPLEHKTASRCRFGGRRGQHYNLFVMGRAQAAFGQKNRF